MNSEQEKVYKREWRAKNREKYNAYQRQYRQNSPSDAVWKVNQREAIGNWKKMNRDKHCESQKRVYHRDLEYSRQKNKESYLRNAEKRKHEAKLYRAEKKRLVIEHYSNNDPKCACCGTRFFDFLTLDHINGGGREHRRQFKSPGSHTIHAWIVKNNFPSGFRILCYNCNCNAAKNESNSCSCPFGK